MMSGDHHLHAVLMSAPDRQLRVSCREEEKRIFLASGWS